MATWVTPRTYSAGAVLTAAQLNETRDNLSVLSTALLITEHQTGLYYASQGTVLTSTGAIPSDTLAASPIFVPATKTYDRLAFLSTLGSASGSVRLGIYEDNAGLPGALVLDGGVITVATSTLYTLTISQSLAGPKKYWLAIVETGTVEGHFMAGVGLAESNAGASGHYAGVSRAFTYAALPNPFGGTPTGANVPKILIRAA